MHRRGLTVAAQQHFEERFVRLDSSMEEKSILAYITDLHGNLSILEKFVGLCNKHVPPPAYVVLGGDISGKYIDYLRLKDRPKESFEEWKESSLTEALALLGEFSGRTFAMLGNDDLESYVDILNGNGRVESLNCKRVYPDGEEKHSLLGFPYVPPTPFMTRFELEEKELKKKMKALLEQILDHRMAIWVFHTPPYNSGLDDTTDLYGGKVIRVKAGSKVVRNAIEKYQPQLFLCGHIHESPGATWLGNTLCVNPGSAASNRRTQAVFVNLDNVNEFKFVSLN